MKLLKRQAVVKELKKLDTKDETFDTFGFRYHRFKAVKFKIIFSIRNIFCSMRGSCSLVTKLEYDLEN